MSAPLTLTEKVYSTISAEHGPMESITYPARPDNAYFTTFELDCRDWGMAYGVAFAIARSEDPFESVESVSDRALAAARDAFARWGGSKIFTSEAYERDRAERSERVEVAS